MEVTAKNTEEHKDINPGHKDMDPDQIENTELAHVATVKEEPTGESFVDEYFRNMEENGANNEQYNAGRVATYPILGQNESDQILISKQPIFTIDKDKTSSPKSATTAKEKRLTDITEKIYANATVSSSSREMELVDGEEIDKMVSTSLDGNSSADSRTQDPSLVVKNEKDTSETHLRSSEDLTSGMSDETDGKEGASVSKTECSTEGTGSNPSDTQPAMNPPPELDNSIFDMSWLSSGEQPLNIADLSFEQFQLLYYQHLFKNTKDVPSPQGASKSGKRSGDISRDLIDKVAKPASGSVSGTASSSTAPVSTATGSIPVAAEVRRASNNESPRPAGEQTYSKPPGFGFTYKCSRCDEVFRSRLELTAHDKRAHATDWDSDLQCQTCKKKFSSKYYLNQHELTHKGELPFSCDLCDKRFLCKGTLETHVILLHTDDRPYKCEECGAAFKLKKILMRHVSTHTKEAPYQCPNCDKRFSRRGSLNRHELIHTGEKPYKCEICEKCFTQKSTLTLHMMGHTNERPFQCPKCNKSFRKKSHLTRHDSVHTGKKRYYECQVCKKCFAEKYCLVEHEKTHEGGALVTQAKVSSDGIVPEESLVSKGGTNKEGNDDKMDFLSEDEENVMSEGEEKKD